EEHGVVVVAGSFTPTDDGRVHNTVIVRGPNWDPHLEYRKIHLFDAFGTDESRTVAPGDDLVTFDLAGTRFGIPPCYDLRFPARRPGDPGPTGLEGGAGQTRAAPAAAARPGAGLHHRRPRRRPVAPAGPHRRRTPRHRPQRRRGPAGAGAPGARPRAGTAAGG